MAVKYARLRSVLELSYASDYSNPKTVEFEDTLTPDEYRLKDLMEITTTVQSYTLSHLGTLTSLLLKNTGTTVVLATVRISKTSKTFTVNKIGFTAVAPCTITDDDSTFVSSLALADGDQVVITGASEAANNGTFFVQSVGAGTLTMAESVAFTLDADDAGTPTVASQRVITVPVAGGQTVILNAVDASYGLTLRTVSGTNEVEISFTGT